jgi:hypothetical protein
MTAATKIERITTEHLERLYKPVGEIVVNWAVIDVTIDNLAAEIFSILGDSHLAFRWPPDFASRLKLIEEHLQKRHVFGDLIVTAKPIFKRIWHVKPLRDSIVHGVPDGYVPATDAVQFSKIDRVPKEERRQVPAISHRAGRRRVRFTMLAAASHALFTINKDLNALLISLRAIARATSTSAADC